MNDPLRPYQIDATDFLLKTSHAALFADCGLGKSRIVLELINTLLNLDGYNKILIVAPLRVAKLQWPLEIEKWDHLKHLKYAVLHGAKKNKALHSTADIYIINYEGIKWLYETLRAQSICPFDMIVLDESTKIKNHSAKRTKMLLKFRDRVKRTVLLTGTPSPQGVGDLFSQVRMLDRGERLGTSYHKFRDKYFNCYDPFGYTYVAKKTAENDIKEKIADLCMYIDTKDHLDLVEPTFHDVDIELPDAVKAEYKELEKNFFIDLDGGSVEAVNAAVLSNKLLQYASGAVYDEEGKVIQIHEAKIDNLVKNFYIIDTPVIICYHYNHEKYRLKKAFPEAVEFSGSSKCQEKVLEMWNAKNIDILLCHPASCGHGLNLQFGGSTIIYFSLPWSYELYHQMNKRIDRPGQVDAPTFYRLIVKDTMEEVVASTLERKETSQKSILDALAAYRRLL